MIDFFKTIETELSIILLTFLKDFDNRANLGVNKPEIPTIVKKIINFFKRIFKYTLNNNNRQNIQNKKIIVHPSAIIDEGATIGEGSRIWHWAHICSKAVIGKQCSLGQNVYVGNNVLIGNNVKIQNNVSVYDEVILEDNVFCGPSMVFTNGALTFSIAIGK